MEIFLRSKYNIEEGDTRLFLSPVTGNTQQYAYDSDIVTSGDTRYLALKGGFYQGFFKLFGYDYQVLPDRINNDIVLHFKLRPRTDYEIPENSVNNLHSDNAGIFFFMGTRAENKFWQIYNGYYPEKQENDYFCDDFYDNTIDNGPYSGCSSCCTYTTDEDFIGTDANVNSQFTDSDGNVLNEQTNYVINSTDNKFIFFDRTPTGFTVNNWEEGMFVRVKNKKRKNINYFTWMNRTETGFTVYDVDFLQKNIELLEGKTIEEIERKKQLELLKDIKNNVLAFRITPEGAIGYKYGVLDCTDDDHYSVLEEYSMNGVVKMNEWNSITIRFAVINPTNDKCDKRPRKMRIMFYVNGYLKFISKELDTPSFRELDEMYQKQEGVPYNISLGGGSIGLLETIMQRYYDVSNYVFPIENDFCGTFIGDISAFKMYLGFIDYCAIKKYLS